MTSAGAFRVPGSSEFAYLVQGEDGETEYAENLAISRDKIDVLLCHVVLYCFVSALARR